MLAKVERAQWRDKITGGYVASKRVERRTEARRKWRDALAEMESSRVNIALHRVCGDVAGSAAAHGCSIVAVVTSSMIGDSTTTTRGRQAGGKALLHRGLARIPRTVY